jgi:hypothetical protein
VPSRALVSGREREERQEFDATIQLRKGSRAGNPRGTHAPPLPASRKARRPVAMHKMGAGGGAGAGARAREAPWGGGRGWERVEHT